MSDLPPDLPPQPDSKSVKDLQSSMSIAIGAGVAFLLSFVPVINSCCLHLALAGFVTIFHYTTANQVSITAGQGIKVAFGGAFVGMILSTLYQDVKYYIAYGRDLTFFKEQVMQELAKSGRDSEEAIEFLNTYVPDELTTSHIVILIVFQLVVGAVAALIGAAIGGAGGAAAFKKGPLAS